MTFKAPSFNYQQGIAGAVVDRMIKARAIFVSIIANERRYDRIVRLITLDNIYLVFTVQYLL